MPNIDGTLPIPLYHQLKDLIRHEITSGALKPGDQLPTEHELEVRYGVSRVTVRQALRDLVQEGLLVRHRARGTFVSLPQMDKALRSAASFTNDMKARGLTPGGQVLRFDEMEAPERVAQALGLAPHTPVVYLERLRLANGEPLALQWNCLESARFPDLLAADLNDRSLYEFLGTHFEVFIMAGRRTIEGIVADRRVAQVLDVHEGAPLLRLGGTNLDQGGRPVEYGETLYRADKYKFFVEF